MLVDLAAALPGFDETGDIEQAAFNALYHDWGRMLRPHPKYEPLGPSIAATIIGGEAQTEQLRESYGFETPRVRFLAGLAPHLEQDQISRAVTLLRDFPETERASALAALLHSADRGNSRLIVAEIHALHGRFARLWHSSVGKNRCARKKKKNLQRRRRESSERSTTPPRSVRRP